jgi:hypothetical protein
MAITTGRQGQADTAVYWLKRLSVGWLVATLLPWLFVLVGALFMIEMVTPQTPPTLFERLLLLLLILYPLVVYALISAGSWLWARGRRHAGVYVLAASMAVQVAVTTSLVGANLAAYFLLE